MWMSVMKVELGCTLCDTGLHGLGAAIEEIFALGYEDSGTRVLLRSAFLVIDRSNKNKHVL
jgi:hypothetical protein